MNPCGTNTGCSIGNFLGYNTLTPSQAAYLSYTNEENTGYSQQIAYGNINGPVYALPAGDIKAAIGFEYRTDNLFDFPDAVTSDGDGAVFSSPTQGGYATGSGYIEVNVPILKDLPFAKSLSADLSGRYDYNTTFGRALTHKEGIDYAIDADFRLRGAHSTGFRAPQVKELYAGHFLNSPSGNDPCAQGGVYFGNAACQASFTAVGLPANFVTTQINQLNELDGGNPNVKPETSQQWSIGGVFTPVELPGLSFAVDYYTILLRDEIASYDSNLLLGACFGGVPYVISQAASCALISPRSKLTGSLGQITALNGNINDENPTASTSTCPTSSIWRIWGYRISARWHSMARRPICCPTT
jgi:iron complex outermembrane receptor protein